MARRFMKRKGRKRDKKKATIGTVKRMMNKAIETKQFPINFSTAVLSATTGSRYNINGKRGNAGVSLVTGVINLNPGNQGVGGFQLIGNKITIKYVEFTVSLHQTASSLLNNNVRVMLIWDKKCQGTDINADELLYDVGSGLAVYSPIQLTGKQQYRVLYDKVHAVGTNGSSTAGLTNKVIRIRHYFPKGLVTTYYVDTTATNYASIIDNNLEVIMFADTGNVTASSAYSNCVYQDA